MSHSAIAFINLFFAGLLAGAELVVRLGVRDTLSVLDDRSHIRLRQALIRTLRVVVPAIMFPAILSGVAVGLTGGVGPGSICRWAAAASSLVFLGITLFGTVPINAAALDWNADTPPPDWQAAIQRWESLNTLRCILAILAFALSLTAAAIG